MAYAVITDAINMYGEDFVLTSLSRDGLPDTDSFKRAAETESSYIDSLIGGRYTVPLPSPAPDVVKRACVDMALYRASSDAGKLTEEKRTRYNDAVAWLDKVAKGLAVIITVGNDGKGDDQGDTDVPILQSSPRLFSRGKMRGLM